MPTTDTTRNPSGPELRLWPGVVLAVLLFVGRYLVPLVAPGAIMAAVLCAFAGTLLILVWWLFFSRAPWLDRLGAVALAILAMVLARPFLHLSVARGNMGFQQVLLGVPLLGLALVIGAAAGRHQSPGRRRAILAAMLLATAFSWTLVRSNGLTGDGMAELAWRFSETAEERLLATSGNDLLLPLPGLATGAGAGEGSPWPGLRGPRRDGVVAGSRLARDWSAAAPVELWRRPIGPAVSSFAVRGQLVYTLEQRGEEEIVAAYQLETGAPVWRHQDQARFWDAHVGAGPRATPAVAGNRVFTLGATGILNALDADTGALLWTRNAAADSGAKPPAWGFVSSPLVVGDLLIVQAGSLLAYDLASGEKRWQGPPERGSYSSPQLLTLEGVLQIVLVAHDTTYAVSPEDGSLLWEHAWDGIGIVQPVRLEGGDLLISLINGAASPIGTRRIRVEKGPTGFTTRELWTSEQLKPSFSDVVVHKGRAFGVDGRILAAVELENGQRVWKGGRYGEAQLLLLPDQDLLLVLGEAGELALVDTRGDSFQELARAQVLEGKCWAQPVLVGNLLLARSGEEMTAFRLPGA